MQNGLNVYVNKNLSLKCFIPKLDVTEEKKKNSNIIYLKTKDHFKEIKVL